MSARLEKAFHLTPFESGEVLVEHHTLADSVHFLVEGTVRDPSTWSQQLVRVKPSPTADPLDAGWLEQLAPPTTSGHDGR